MKINESEKMKERNRKTKETKSYTLRRIDCYESGTQQAKFLKKN